MCCTVARFSDFFSACFRVKEDLSPASPTCPTCPHNVFSIDENEEIHHLSSPRFPFHLSYCMFADGEVFSNTMRLITDSFFSECVPIFQMRMRLCVASNNPLRLQNQCVYCHNKKFQQTVRICTGTVSPSCPSSLIFCVRL